MRLRRFSARSDRDCECANQYSRWRTVDNQRNSFFQCSLRRLRVHSFAHAFYFDGFSISDNLRVWELHCYCWGRFCVLFCANLESIPRDIYCRLHSQCAFEGRVLETARNPLYQQSRARLQSYTNYHNLNRSEITLPLCSGLSLSSSQHM